MRSALALPAVIVLLVGAIFTGQGLGYIKGSFMTGSRFWFVVGVVMVVLSLAALYWSWRPGAAKRR